MNVSHTKPWSRMGSLSESRGGSKVTKPIFSSSGKRYCLTIPVQKGCVCSGFWLVQENMCFSAQSEGRSRLWVISCVLTQNDTWSSVACHVCLGRSPRLCLRWEVPISAQNARDIVRTLSENLTGKYAGYFAGIVTVVYLRICENIHRFTNVFIAENIS